jgi:S-adenosylmethionine:tRNA ribosyltransferase-isomerase
MPMLQPTCDGRAFRCVDTCLTSGSIQIIPVYCMIDDDAINDQAVRFDIADLDYCLPAELIAQQPPPSREDARLLVVNRATSSLSDAQIVDLPDLLSAGDLLILNDTKVLPARVFARRMTGGVVAGLFVREEAPGRWEVMLQGSRRLRVGERLCVAAITGGPIELELIESLGEGHWVVEVDSPGPAEEVLARIGRAPLPPYIRRDSSADPRDLEDRERYQTVFAQRPGAIAAPTAGLHLTRPLLDAIRTRGIETAFVTLHVGAGTFKPISADRLDDHIMHSECYDLPQCTADAVRACRDRGGRVIAVGTTSVRVLESAAVGPGADRTVEPRAGVTDLFIFPPYQLQVVDAMLTNFHLPRSTLLALVMAMGGIDYTRRAYEHAVRERYRFYSYGDAMLIL